MTNLLLTGRPGCGKTTLVSRVAAHLGDRAGGFVTREIRRKRSRVGFAIETLDGQAGTLAHVDQSSEARVGRYGVHLEDLERLAVPAILKAAQAGRIVVIDEIGKMELFSRCFREAVLHALDSPARVLATVHRHRDPFTEGIRARPDVDLVEVTPENRDRLAQRIPQAIGGDP